MIEAAFWICLSLIAYAYAGYPLTVWVAARLFGGLPTRPSLDAAEFPFVSNPLLPRTTKRPSSQNGCGTRSRSTTPPTGSKS